MTTTTMRRGTPLANATPTRRAACRRPSSSPRRGDVAGGSASSSSGSAHAENEVKNNFRFSFISAFKSKTFENDQFIF